MSEAKPISELEPREELFCQEYVVDLNATRAAMRAGYSPTNERAASVSAARLLVRARVADRIEQLMDERNERVKISQDIVLLEAFRIANSDPGLILDESGAVLPMNQIPEEIRKCIASIEVFEEFEGTGNARHKIGETKKVKFWDKGKAIELLAKHKALLTDNLKVTGTMTLEQLVAGSNKED